ncbi:MAG: hypothetical protein ACI9BW_004354 [Gammaproteobacteria bacterium]|jgi:hypothetical protein
MTAWGLTPKDVRERLLAAEWQHDRHQRARLLGERPYPIRVLLKAPTGSAALDDVARFHQFTTAWKTWPVQSQIEWENRKYRQIGEQQVPIAFNLGSLDELIDFLGHKVRDEYRTLQQLVAPLVADDSSYYPILVRNIERVRQLAPDEVRAIARLLPQLHQGMAKQCFPRALPVTGIDTKFIETHANLISALLDQRDDGAVSTAGDLWTWLGTRHLTKDRIWVRPLCAQTRSALANIDYLQLTSDVLRDTRLACERVIIIENEQSGYAVGNIPLGLAIFGAGRNLAWMQAEWLREKKIAYWGDLDSWGFEMLSQARGHQPHTQSLMMDRETVLRHQQRLVDERSSYPAIPPYLNENEIHLFMELRDCVYGGSRLEQERLSADFIRARIADWISEF